MLNTKKTTRKYHLYCWDHVFKENEWCLVDKLRVSTQIMVCNCCLTKCRKFSACGRLSMALWANFFVIQNVYINVNLTVKEGNQSFPYENHSSVTKSSHQDCGSCYLHLPIFFLYIHSPLQLEKKVVVIAVFLCKLDQRPLFNDIY